MIAPCKTVRAEYRIPGSSEGGSATNDRSITPSTIAMTGEPKIGAYGARIVAAIATTTATKTPGRVGMRKINVLPARLGRPIAAFANRSASEVFVR